MIWRGVGSRLCRRRSRHHDNRAFTGTWPLPLGPRTSVVTRHNKTCRKNQRCRGREWPQDQRRWCFPSRIVLRSSFLPICQCVKRQIQFLQLACIIVGKVTLFELLQETCPHALRRHDAHIWFALIPKRRHELQARLHGGFQMVPAPRARRHVSRESRQLFFRKIAHGGQRAPLLEPGVCPGWELSCEFR